jgi:hypothetical protein
MRILQRRGAVSDYARDALSWAITAGIILGGGDDKIDPKVSASSTAHSKKQNTPRRARQNTLPAGASLYREPQNYFL